MVHSAAMKAGPVACIALAAGQGVRMKSGLPKVLHPLCGVPMIAHCVRSLAELAPERLIIVIGNEDEQGPAETAQYSPQTAGQADPRATGHAAMAAAPLLADFAGDVLIVPADAPLIRSSTYAALVEQRRDAACAAAVLAAAPDDPTGYGRIVRDESGAVQRIVEHCDASDAERQIREINTSVYCFDCRTLLDVLPRIGQDNAQNEYYLTDAIGLLVADGQRVMCTVTDDADETRGINDRIQLAAAEAQMRQSIREALMANGVTMIEPSSTFIDAEVSIGADTTIWPGAVLTRGSEVGARCTMGPSCLIHNSRIGDECRIEHCAHIADSVVGPGTRVAAFASVSDGAQVPAGATVDSFARLRGAGDAEGA
ncbi:MAG: NTP transferase domain-containing protein [Armatimonadota bacterium]